MRAFKCDRAEAREKIAAAQRVRRQADGDYLTNEAITLSVNAEAKAERREYRAIKADNDRAARIAAYLKN